MRILSSIFICAMLAACNVTPPPSTLLHGSLREISPHGGTTVLPEKRFSAFQRLMRGRMGTAAGAGVVEVFCLEVALPQGAGDEGAYIAILRRPSSAEFDYFEQAGHQPRYDRYYHRALSAAEQNEFFGFLKAHPLSALRPPATTLPPAGEAATREAAPNAAEADAEPQQGPGIVFRFTQANARGGSTIVLADPTEADHPAIDLIRLFSRMRDAMPPAANASNSSHPATALICTYIQPIPATARVLFADPQRRVLRVWSQGDDLRAVIMPPLPNPGAATPFPDSAATAPEAGDPAPPPSAPAPSPAIAVPALVAPAAPLDPATADLPWYTYRNDTWQPSPPPSTSPSAIPPSASAFTTPPATPPSSAAPTASPAATAPAPPADNTMPLQPIWKAAAGPNFTTVWHYLPIDRQSGQWQGFNVPNLVFDDDHWSVNEAYQMIYLINDGQLLSLPIPQSALLMNR